MTQYFFPVKTWMQLWENEAEDRKNCAIVYTAIDRLIKNYKSCDALLTSIDALYEHMYHAISKNMIEAALKELEACHMISITYGQDEFIIAVNYDAVDSLEKEYMPKVNSKTQNFSVYYFAVAYATEHSITSAAFPIMLSRLVIDLNFGYFKSKLSTQYLQKKFANVFSIDEIRDAMALLHNEKILVNTSENVDFDAWQEYVPSIEHIKQIICDYDAKINELRASRYTKYDFDLNTISN